MQLSMTVLRCPDRVAPETRTVSGGEFHVGRGPDVDWVLPDPDRLLSKRHFAVAFRAGNWQVADTSTNGTYLNTDPDPIGRGTPRSLRDGDRLRLGAYEIEIRVVDQPAQPVRTDGGFSGAYSGFGAEPAARSDQSPFGDPFADDLLAPAPAARRPFDEPAYRSDLGAPQTSAQLPHDFDPLAPDHEDEGFGAGFRGPVQQDHSSAMQDALIPPPVSGYAAPNAGGIIPGDDLLPDDWDKDLLEGIASPSQTPPLQASPPRTPAPGTQSIAFSDPAPGPMPRRTVSLPQSSAALSSDGSPFAAPTPRPSAAPDEIPLDFDEPVARSQDACQPPAADAFVAAPAVAPVVRQRAPRPAVSQPPVAPQQGSPETSPFSETGLAGPPGASPFDEPPDLIGEPSVAAGRPFPATPDFGSAQRQTAPAASPAAAAPAAPAMDEASALAAFFKGAELSGATPSDPMAMMSGLGQAFRAVVSGLRAVLIARATIKSEFRIEQTMIRARGNNPLKFSANDDDALTALLGVGRRTDMGPAAAIEDSMRDLRLHELATMAAMQVAVRAMLEELSPDKLRAASEQGGMSVLPGQRKARAWDAFEARHATIVQALVDDFDSVFGKSFARAYERALDEISMRERQ